MSYHSYTPTSTNQSTSSTTTTVNKQSFNAQGQAAPVGYHYMPDGSLMADSEMAQLSGAYSITNFAPGVTTETEMVMPLSNIYHQWKFCWDSHSNIVNNSSSPTYNPTPHRLFNNSVPGAEYPSTGTVVSTPAQFAAESAATIVFYNTHGAPNVGQTIKLKGIMPGLFNKTIELCYEYLGYTQSAGPPMIFDAQLAAVYTATFSDCISCKDDITLIPPSTWDCVKKTPYIGEVSPNNLFNTFGGISQCVERIFPQIGQFPTQQACVASCSSGPTFPGGPTFPVGTSLPKLINSFNLDLSDLTATSERRHFNILGDKGAEFKLEIKDNTTGYYYNFVTNVFQAASSSLEEQLSSQPYNGSITFPAITGGDDQYDISLYAKPGTKHVTYNEVRFGDGSLDINSSTGSNSLMMTKVIYQYAALTLTLAGYSTDGTVGGTFGTDTISINRGKSNAKKAFSFIATAGATAAYRILKQPISNDILAFVQPVVGAAPIDLPGENIYPTATAAFTGDDINGVVTSGAVVRMDNTDLSAVIKVGDKITTPTTTSTVDGAVSSGVNVQMDHDVTTIMAVGDQVTELDTGGSVFNNKTVTVATLSVGGDDSVFAMSEAVALSDGVPLIFSSKINRSLTTVTVVETSGTATDFTMSQAIQFRDNCPLTFFSRKNFSWPINKFADILREGMIVVATGSSTADTSIGGYEDTVTLFEGTKEEKVVVKNKKEAISTLAKKPTVVKGLVTVQEGQIVFDKQQAFALAGATLKAGGYGESEILRVYGWDVKFTDLAITLTAPTTTTTEATSAHATIAVADREGIINTVSTVSGIGINPSVADPTLTTGGGLDGAGDWIMSATQTLESGVTLTVGNTGRIATITGNIQIVKAGTASQTLRFDVNKLLSTSAP